ncbi:hypothetical protein CALCODRAFT_536816, partial [Calocera cornea HHB12733]
MPFATPPTGLRYCPKLHLLRSDDAELVPPTTLSGAHSTDASKPSLSAKTIRELGKEEGVQQFDPMPTLLTARQDGSPASLFSVDCYVLKTYPVPKRDADGELASDALFHHLVWQAIEGKLDKYYDIPFVQAEYEDCLWGRSQADWTVFAQDYEIRQPHRPYCEAPPAHPLNAKAWWLRDNLRRDGVPILESKTDSRGKRYDMCHTDDWVKVMRHNLKTQYGRQCKFDPEQYRERQCHMLHKLKAAVRPTKRRRDVTAKYIDAQAEHKNKNKNKDKDKDKDKRVLKTTKTTCSFVRTYRLMHDAESSGSLSLKRLEHLYLELRSAPTIQPFSGSIIQQIISSPLSPLPRITKQHLWLLGGPSIQPSAPQRSTTEFVGPGTTIQNPTALTYWTAQRDAPLANRPMSTIGLWSVPPSPRQPKQQLRPLPPQPKQQLRPLPPQPKQQLRPLPPQPKQQLRP